MLVTLGHCNTSALNVSVLHLVFEPATHFLIEIDGTGKGMRRHCSKSTAA
jgi:hypothetical protein